MGGSSLGSCWSVLHCKLCLGLQAGIAFLGALRVEGFRVQSCRVFRSSNLTGCQALPPQTPKSLNPELTRASSLLNMARYSEKNLHRAPAIRVKGRLLNPKPYVSLELLEPNGFARGLQHQNGQLAVHHAAAGYLSPTVKAGCRRRDEIGAAVRRHEESSVWAGRAFLGRPVLRRFRGGLGT